MDGPGSPPPAGGCVVGGAVVAVVVVVAPEGSVVVVGGGSPALGKRAMPWATAFPMLSNSPATNTYDAVTWRSSTPWTPPIDGPQLWIAPVDRSKAARCWRATLAPLTVRKLKCPPA